MSKTPVSPTYAVNFNQLPEEIRNHCGGCPELFVGMEMWDEKKSLTANCNKYNLWWHDNTCQGEDFASDIHALAQGFTCDDPEVDAGLMEVKP